jgi:hypothetical protein
MDFVEDILEGLQVPRPAIDAFSWARSKRFEKFWGPDSPICQDAFVTSWNVRYVGLLWMNPPFSQLGEVVQKIKSYQAHRVIGVPHWREQEWFKSLQSVSLRCMWFKIGDEVFELVGEKFKVPPIKWEVLAFYSCGRPRVCEIAISYAQGWVSFPQKKSKTEGRKVRRLKLEKFRKDTNPSNDAPLAVQVGIEE